MEIKIKKLNEKAIIPSYSKSGDAGLDLTAVGIYQPQRNTDGSAVITYSTGIAVEIPEGFVGLIFSRSSVSDTSLTLANCVGVIDSGYRGEILCKFKSTATFPALYQPGDRIAQLIVLPYPQIEFIEVTELSETERGEDGFGSTNIIQDESNETTIDSEDTITDMSEANAVYHEEDGDTPSN